MFPALEGALVMTSQTHIKDLKGVMHSDMSQKTICPMHQALGSEERHSKKYRAEEKSAFFLVAGKLIK